MISCERASTLFGAAWDDELSVSEREALETHFTTCPACQRGYDEFARTLELVQHLPRPVVSDDFAERVVREARARELGLSRREGRPAIFAAFGGRLALAAAVLATVGVGAFVMTRPSTLAPVAVPSSGGRALVATAQKVAPKPALPALHAGDPDGPVTARAPLATPLVPGVPAFTGARHKAQHGTLSGGAMAAMPDSLFDHSQDVDFVLDPVKLRRERGRGYTPVTSSVQGQAASITF